MGISKELILTDIYVTSKQERLLQRGGVIEAFGVGLKFTMKGTRQVQSGVIRDIVYDKLGLVMDKK